MKSRPLTLILLCVLAATSMAQDGLEVTAEDLYYEARAQLRDGEYLDAADGFERVAEDHRENALAPKALYWRAFALAREGERSNLIEAKNSLELLFDRYPEQARQGDSRELIVEIQGELARLGDGDAAAEIARLADEIRGHERDMPERADDGERRSDETRLAALNALMQMDSRRAFPILEKILVENPDRHSADFRERAVFLLSQNGDHERTIDTFVHVIRNDSSQDVREQAVFWLSQTHDDRTVDILEELARSNTEDHEIRDKAIFALSQVGDQRANRVLRDIATDPAAPNELRAQSVFWIGQSNDPSAGDFLVELYGEVEDDDIKDKAIFALSQLGGRTARDFMMSIVRDANESTEARKQALFWLGQMGREIDPDVVMDLFETIDDVEVREQAVFVLSQMGGGRGVDALIDIARNADDGELREKAIFWLGQTDDERAADFLAELIAEDF